MSAVPHDHPERPTPPPRGWQQRRGLTFAVAKQLLDHLEACGVSQREMTIEDDGVCVRWRGEWPRLLAE